MKDPHLSPLVEKRLKLYPEYYKVIYEKRKDKLCNRHIAKILGIPFQEINHIVKYMEKRYK